MLFTIIDPFIIESVEITTRVKSRLAKLYISLLLLIAGRIVKQKE